jgi:polyhydroxyalkanoate synthase subunit PhaE
MTDIWVKNFEIPCREKENESLMSEQTNNPFDMTAMFDTWMKSMDGLWRFMGGAVNAAPTPEPAKDGASQRATPKAQQTIAATLKNWQTMSTAISSPESIAAILKGSGAMPEMLSQLAQTSLAGFMELQQNMIQQLSRLGDSVEAYQFEDIDENIFRLWTDIYEREFRRFFQIPQLGLMREYQEKACQAADKFNLLQSNLAELMRMLGLPFTRSMQVMQEKVIELAEKGELSDDTRAYYQMWIKVLEGHFMTLFQTPEYVETLARTVNALADFSSARNAALEDMLGMLPIARKAEMDDMARDLYELKKRLRRLEKKTDQ